MSSLRDTMMERYVTDADFKAALDGVGSVDEAVAVSRAHGFDVTADDFRRREDAAARDGSELSDSDLGYVSGGSLASTYFPGGCP